MDKNSMRSSDKPNRNQQHAYRDDRITPVRNPPHDDEDVLDDYEIRLIQAILKMLLPFLIAISVTPFCIYLGMKSGAAGHGQYIMAKLFFPYTMISTCFFGTITIPFIILAVIEFPVYGIIIGIAWYKRSLIRWASGLLIVHVLSALVALVMVSF